MIAIETKRGKEELSKKHVIFGVKQFADPQRLFGRKLSAWLDKQDKNRLLWMGIIFISQCCVLTPLTAFAVYATSRSFVLFMMAFVAMDAALVTSLAAVSTKYIVPLYFFSVLVDVCIIACSILAVVL